MRRFGYGAIGILIGVIVYVMLLVNIPVGVDAKSALIEFTKGNSNSEYTSDEEDFKAGSIVPFLEYGSYHVSASELNNYEKSEIVKYGKANPTFYFKKAPVPEPELDENGNVIDSEEMFDEDNHLKDLEGSDNPEEYESKDLSKVSVLEGFNIHTRQEEIVDIVDIKESFNKYGKLPLDKDLYNITSGFGERLDPFEKLRSYHVGLDISADEIEGKNVYAAIHGEVIESISSDTGYGNHIVIQHDGFETLYAHMQSKPLFEIGDQVQAGDILGYVGSTGRSTGPHLHFEVGIGGVKLDPQAFINEIGRND